MKNLPRLLDEVSTSFKEEVIENKLNFSIKNQAALNELRTFYHTVKSLIIVRLDAIGDSILFSNSFRQLRSLFPNAKITAMVYLETQEIMERNPYVDTAIYVDRKSIQTDTKYWENVIKVLRKLEYDLLINPLYSRDYFSDEIVRFIRAQYKIGVQGDESNIIAEVMDVTNRNYNYLLKANSEKIRFELHRNAEIISLLGSANNPDELPELWLSEKDEQFVDRFLNDYNIRDYAVVFPGGKGGKSSPKYWGSENFAKLIDYLQLKEKIKVLVLEGPGDDNICTEISALCKSDPLIFQGHFNIWQVAQFIKNSLFYIGTDTSITHLSAAVNKHTVVLLGGGHFGRFFPYPSARHVFSVYKIMDCYLCNWKCTQNFNKCLKALTLNDVLQPVKPILAGYKKNVNIVKSLGSKPGIDLLLPPGNIHSWHLKEGFLHSLNNKGLLNKVFYSSEEYYAHIFKYLKSGGNADLLIALGGDHHLHYLHDTPEKREFWKRYKKPKLCYSYESTVDTIYPFYPRRALNAADIFTHILVADEKDIGFWKKQNKPVAWLPQFVDEKLFRSVTPLDKRKNKLFFKGKLTWVEYEERRKFIAVLRNAGLCDITDQFVSTTELVSLYNSYMFAINPPGVFGGFNVRTFEALACGNILLQYKHKSRPMNNSLFSDKQHLIYFDMNNISKTVEEIDYYLKHAEDYFEVAETGYQELLNYHTVDKRIDSILSWIDNGKTPEFPNFSVSAKKESTVGKEKLRLKNKNLKKTSYHSTPKVSAIVSAYNSEKYICGCLDDLLNQTLYKKGELEIVVVVSGSEENEEDVVKEYQKSNPNIKLIVTEKRETVYKAWNRGIKAASGKYITNANTDDRHRSDALEILAKELDENKDVALVYADCKVTQTENSTFYNTPLSGYLLWPEFDRKRLFEICFIGPQPLWRKSLHSKYGYFDEKFKSAGDYEYWLRISAKEKFKHVNQLLGLYLLSEDSIENSDKITSQKESELARVKHWKGKGKRPAPNGMYFIPCKESKRKIEEPLFSVIIPTYNRSGALRKALDSLTKQSFTRFEVIVVNDGSIDESGIVDQYEGKLYIRYLHHLINRERSASRNDGIKTARGKYITFLDDDDIYYSDHLKVLSENLEDGFDVYYTDSVRAVYAKTAAGYKLIKKYVPYSIDYSRDKLLIGNIAPINCFAVSRSLAIKAGLFDESINVLEDWEFLLRLSGYSEFKHIKKSTTEVSWKDDGTTTTSKRGNEFAQVREKIYKKYQRDISKIKNKDEIIAGFNAIWKNDFASNRKQVSIIIPTYNQIEYTKQCLSSIEKYTGLNYEVIVVDNASTDNTVDEVKKYSNVRVIKNSVNVGFPKAVNTGIKDAEGKYIVIMNNDIIVTEGWLNRMIEVAESNPAIGIVGPVSNSVSGIQLDKDANYNTIEAMHEYSAKVRIKNANETFEFPRVAFLCTLIKRDVIERIGGLDERFSPGNFEDDDFCLRAQLAGFKTVIAKDVFVHHFGSKSFKADGNEKYVEIIETNKQKFVEKWGADPEEIWLKGKNVKKREIVYPVDSNKFSESFQRALIDIKEKEFGSASENLKEAISNYNYAEEVGKVIEFTKLLNLAGNVSLYINDYDSAKSYFEEELNLDPDSSTACAGLAELLMIEGNYKAAKTMYELALKNDPDNKTASFGLQKAESLSKQDENNVKEYESEGMVVPEIDKLLTEANTNFEKRNFEEALKLAAEAEGMINNSRLNGQKSSLLVSLNNFKGFVNLELNNIDEAKICFETALQLDPDSSDASAGLGEIFYRSGMNEEAKVMYEWAVKNNDKNSFASLGLKKVNKVLGYGEEHNSLFINNVQ